MRTRKSALTGEPVQVTTDGRRYIRVSRHHYSVLVPLDLAHDVANALVDLAEEVTR